MGLKLLLSNDDGIRAPGLKTLAQVLTDVADIQVVAPDRDRSGASSSLTLDRPLEPQLHRPGFYSINGTPTDCVHLGISGLFDHQPEMVIAGINAGANLGDDVLYSGTVAAAIEGRYLPRPALAVSLVGKEHYATAAEIVRQLIAQIDRLNLAPRTVLNINVPDRPLEAVQGIHITRMGHRRLAAQPVRTVDPRGKARYWVAAVGEAEDAGPGTDFYAIEQGYVSITPLQVDMTQYSGFDNLGLWLEGLA